MKLFYRKQGQGEPLFILHGLFGSSDNWQTLAKQFAENFEVYVIDQRNHGQSPHSSEWTYASMAEDLLEIIDDNFLPKVNIIGHSMGGKTAMYFALKYPQLVKKLVVVDIAPKYYPPHHSDIISTLQSINLNKITSRKDAEEIMDKTIKEFGVKQFLLKNLYWKNEKLAWRFNLNVIAENVINVGEENLPSSPTKLDKPPTLFVRGENSNYIKDEDLPLLKSLFPLATLETIKNAGHWVQAEQPQSFYECVFKFLK